MAVAQPSTHPPSWRQALTACFRLVWNSWSSCLRPLGWDPWRKTRLLKPADMKPRQQKAGELFRECYSATVDKRLTGGTEPSGVLGPVPFSCVHQSPACTHLPVPPDAEVCNSA